MITYDLSTPDGYQAFAEQVGPKLAAAARFALLHGSGHQIYRASHMPSGEDGLATYGVCTDPERTRYRRFTVWYANQAINRVSLREAVNCFNIAVRRGIVFG